LVSKGIINNWIRLPLIIQKDARFNKQMENNTRAHDFEKNILYTSH
jgi:hypothetical protein